MKYGEIVGGEMMRLEVGSGGVLRFVAVMVGIGG